MLKMIELRDKIKECTVDITCFSTSELKEKLKEMGYAYNVDYDVTTFSNAVSSLVKQNYIVSLDNDRKGNYKIIKNDSFDYKTECDIQNEENMKTEEIRKKSSSNNEAELKSMRTDIKIYLNDICKSLEEKLDSKKPSTYGRNIQTYRDILRLIEMLKRFEFTIKDKDDE